MIQNIEVIKLLRNASGMGIMECRKALEQSSQDYQHALSLLQEKAAESLKKSTDDAIEGRIEVYSHHNGRIGVMVEIGSQTEFASRTEVFRSFAHEIALQIASTSPQFVRAEDIPQGPIDELLEEFTGKAQLLGKSEVIVGKIREGALEKYINENVLLRQRYIRDETITVYQLVEQTSNKLGEHITVRRFIRWEISPDSKDQV
jgi:elongation factor Ts